MGTLWFCLATIVIIGYVLLDGFDLGAGIVQLFVARAEPETDQVLGSIGPVWDGNEVWLLAAGGTLLFAFPVLYASAFQRLLSLINDRALVVDLAWYLHRIPASP